MNHIATKTNAAFSGHFFGIIFFYVRSFARAVSIQWPEGDLPKRACRTFRARIGDYYFFSCFIFVYAKCVCAIQEFGWGYYSNAHSMKLRKILQLLNEHRIRYSYIDRIEWYMNEYIHDNVRKQNHWVVSVSSTSFNALFPSSFCIINDLTQHDLFEY